LCLGLVKKKFNHWLKFKGKEFVFVVLTDQSKPIFSKQIGNSEALIASVCGGAALKGTTYWKYICLC